MSEKPQWIFNHLGARAHYEMARALQNEGLLEKLITDIWIPASFPTGNYFSLLNKFLERRSADIPDKKVKSFISEAIFFEILSRIDSNKDWDLILKRNNWYQQKVRDYLHTFSEDGSSYKLFSFAYTALLPFQIGRAKGWKTILYQMDPGLAEEKIVKEAYKKTGITKTAWKEAPKIYWENWKKECEIADAILVNSDWSKKCLIDEGISEDKINVIRLSYTPPVESISFVRQYPDKFTVSRPMKVLFLGTLTVRKGIHFVLDAAKRLKGMPIEFALVGQQEFPMNLNLSNVKYFNSVSRSAVNAYYKNADVFLFPTLSDGFGLTQLEALSWSLPVISTNRCGSVVTDRVNGIVLATPSVDAIVEELIYLIEKPDLLRQYSEKSKNELSQYSTSVFAGALSKIGC